MSTLTTTAKMKIFKTQYSEEYNRIDPDQKLSNKGLMKHICSIIEQSQVNHMGIDMSGFKGILSRIKNMSQNPEPRDDDSYSEEVIDKLTDFITDTENTPIRSINRIIIETSYLSGNYRPNNDEDEAKAEESEHKEYRWSKDASGCDIYDPQRGRSLSEIMVSSLHNQKDYESDYQKKSD